MLTNEQRKILFTVIDTHVKDDELTKEDREDIISFINKPDDKQNSFEEHLVVIRNFVLNRRIEQWREIDRKRQITVKKEVVGYADVDSGQIMIIDPGYVLPDDRGDGYDSGDPSNVAKEKATIKEGEETSIYLRASGLGPGGDTHKNYRQWHNGFVTNTLWGDGSYPIIAELNEFDQIIRLVVDFNPELDEEEDTDV